MVYIMLNIFRKEISMINALPNTLQRKILLVADNWKEDNLIRYAMNASMPNAMVISVQSTYEAYKAYKEHDFDLIILDVNLNETFGSSPVRRIKVFNETAPIVVISELATPDGIGDALSQGAACIMQKRELMGSKFVNMLDHYLG